MTSPITTHILDLSRGRPAPGIVVVLSAWGDAERWQELAGGMTDADGRLQTLLAPGTPLVIGDYRLDFATAAYFQAAGVPSFYPAVTIQFRVDDSTGHYHVPLLLSPYGYSTYRGS